MNKQEEPTSITGSTRLALVPTIAWLLFAVLTPTVATSQAESNRAQSSAKETVSAYAAAWNENDVEERRALLEKAWADDGIYTDPTAEVKGREALIEHISGFQAEGNGARIVRTSKVDSHHGSRLRFSWKMVSADGQTLAEGLDYGELDGDGRLELIVGFFGPFTPLEN